MHKTYKEPDGPVVECNRLALAQDKQHLQSPVIGMVTKDLSYQASPCFEKHLVPGLNLQSYALIHESVMSSHDGLWSVLLVCSYTFRRPVYQQ
jgi:hypothetical protein